MKRVKTVNFLSIFKGGTQWQDIIHIVFKGTDFQISQVSTNTKWRDCSKNQKSSEFFRGDKKDINSGLKEECFSQVELVGLTLPS